MSQLNQNAIREHNPFQGPIPGQSLTNSPDSRQPWENPPEVTGIKDARELMFLEILKESNLENIAMLLNDGMSVAEITEMLLFIGYSKGKFNADMMLLLAEPVMYMLLAVAEAIGIDPKINRDDLINADEEDLDEEEEADVVNLSKSIQTQVRNPSRLEELQTRLDADNIPSDIKERVAQVDFEGIKESLMARPQRQQTENPSLLGR
tara:strand:+ start:2888 stop:3508 length:621 start_codon:yes stop_codon:yes gene_type:complete